MGRFNRNVVYRCCDLVGFWSRCPRAVLIGRVERRLKELVSALVAEKLGGLDALEALPDQVHVLVAVDPRFGVHRLVKRVKGALSRRVHEEFRALRTCLLSLWASGYFVATTGGGTLDVAGRYVAQQKGR